jgi:hypothetical protein
VHIGPRPAYDGAGKQIRDVLIVDTAGGTRPHLTWAAAEGGKTFCGLEPRRVSLTWFAMVGCAKCTRSARTQGVAQITDSDGELITL